MSLGDDDGFQFLDVEQKNEVAIVTLRRPPVNAVNQAMYRRSASCSAAWTSSVRGSRWSSARRGQALLGRQRPRRVPDAHAGELRRADEAGARAFSAIYDCPVPVIAAVHAMRSAPACLVGPATSLSAPRAPTSAPRGRRRVMGGAKHLSRLVPQQVVRLMYLTATGPGAELARTAVVRIVPDTELLDAAFELAERIARTARGGAHGQAEPQHHRVHGTQTGYEFEQRLTASWRDRRLEGGAPGDHREAPTRFGSLPDARALTATRASRELRRCDFPERDSTVREEVRAFTSQLEPSPPPLGRRAVQVLVDFEHAARRGPRAVAWRRVRRRA